ncbi:diacylglycerol kinase family protein [Micrococcus sp.]|uniref:diacylglycerol kinase family protein n=1 Tax=Micrococcus sp. TaxID=1271 RepID=UPI002A9196EA|nr:diacylglycerol kinase family protein [Micrococcus sp.]MDY6054669.1 diacylglycerol kinase family protein [Micrococcus sp.]
MSEPWWNSPLVIALAVLLVLGVASVLLGRFVERTLRRHAQEREEQLQELRRLHAQTQQRLETMEAQAGQTLRALQERVQAQAEAPEQARPGAAAPGAVPGQGPQVALVVNPTKSGTRQLRLMFQALAIEEGLGPVLVLETTAEDPGSAMARQAVEAGVRTVVAAGGDGTVRTVAEQLTGTDVALGVVPLGTGNLLARNLDLPIHDVEECAWIALTGHRRQIDTVEVQLTGEDGQRTRQTFTVMGGTGYDAEIMGDTKDELKDKAGWLAYSEAGLRHLGGRRHRIEVSFDGGPFETHSMRSLLVANCGMLTAGMELLPEAKLDDGLLDVLILSPRNTMDWARIAVKTLTRHRRDLDSLQTRQARRVQVRLVDPMLSQLDGDATGRITALEAQVRPNSLTMMIRDEDGASLR